eukprot:CAMPEP_0184334484 /NCGR_PEP_ID=MMETSP1089-20130417/3256_1 /TAXON_ID=38269 ORGANISM="Gloeochaete wittrockiana, Strain SAG46.84" /NCGR_SAMPLE_ID=MMETSP1089 /ASSEMBLY_ACC=CAM_ASM_000445 /LENGTH=594 /DNA_ID=CAMNT_0026658757 /DNA_START=69 /DNA_END=1853 /DNA_ORIENTATION=+
MDIDVEDQTFDDAYRNHGRPGNPAVNWWNGLELKWKIAVIAGLVALIILFLVVVAFAINLFFFSGDDGNGGSSNNNNNSTVVNNNSTIVDTNSKPDSSIPNDTNSIPDDTNSLEDSSDDEKVYPPPFLPASYTTGLSMLVYVTFTNENTNVTSDVKLEDFSGAYANDADSKNLKMLGTNQLWQNTMLTMLVTSLGEEQYQVINEECTKNGVEDLEYQDLFFWIGFDGVEQDESTTIVSGIECIGWTLSLGMTDISLTLFVDVDSYDQDTQIPVQMIANFDDMYYKFQFSNFFEGAQLADLEIPEQCVDLFICEAQEAPADQIALDLYAFGALPDDPSDFYGSDSNSLATNLCYSIFTDSDYLEFVDYISRFNVAANTTWGPLAYCIDDICEGSVDGTVGRQVTLTLSSDPHLGQCDKESRNLYGYDYSLSSSSQCTSDQELGDDSCAWMYGGVQKVVELECLMGYGLYNSCLADYKTATLTNTQNLIDLAFSYDSADQKGCPNVVPEGYSFSFPSSFFSPLTTTTLPPYSAYYTTPDAPVPVKKSATTSGSGSSVSARQDEELKRISRSKLFAGIDFSSGNSLSNFFKIASRIA